MSDRGFLILFNTSEPSFIIALDAQLAQNKINFNKSKYLKVNIIYFSSSLQQTVKLRDKNCNWIKDSKGIETCPVGLCICNLLRKRQLSKYQNFTSVDTVSVFLINSAFAC